MATPSQKLHALIIGIDDYPIKHHKLNGCVNDATAMRNYLEGQFACDDLSIKTLFNGDAKRQNIVDAFQHYKAAKDGDVCFLYYSGHGSQAPAPKEFRHLDPDGMLETLVCWDSRLAGGRDLLDKELSYLIWDATQGKDVHFVAVFDCCHSGTNTRNLGVTPRKAEARDLPDYLQDFRGVENYRISDSDRGREFTPPRGRHVQLAAARDSETAKELQIGNATRGAFTYNLISLLEQHAGALRYQDIVEHLRPRIANYVAEQSPQLDATHSQDKGLYFLGRAPQFRDPYFTVDYDGNAKAWFVNAGQVHGLPYDRANDIRFTVKTPEGEKEVEVAGVEMTRSRLDTRRLSLQQDQSYQALLREAPLSPAKLYLLEDAAAAAMAAVRQAVKDSSQLYYQLTDKPDEADYHVRYIDGSLRLTLPGDDRPLFRRVEGHDERAVGIFLGDVAAVAKWRHVRTISNPRTTIRDEDFELEWLRVDPAHGTDDDNSPAERLDWQESQTQVFRYDFDASKTGADRWLKPSTRLRIRNKSNRELYFSAVNLSPDFGIANRFLPGIFLKPGEEVWCMDYDYKTIELRVDDTFLKQGVNELTEVMKIFISTKQIDTNKFNQDALEMDEQWEKATTRAGRERPSRPAQDDWRTVDLIMQVVRPALEADLEGGRSVAIGETLRIEMPAGVSGMAALNNRMETERQLAGTRSLDAEPLRLPEATDGWAAFPLGEGMANAQPVSILELYDVRGAENVNADSPARIQLRVKPQAGEFVLPLAYDPETNMYYPLGLSDENGVIVLDELPEPTAAGTRSLGGSIKIFFTKTLAQYLPVEYNHPQMAKAGLELLDSVATEGVDLDELARNASNLKVVYENDLATIKQAVADAKTIVLYTHGIIGDTLDMPKSLKLARDAAGEELAKHYDLVLTFDYENLKTPIQETAADLKRKLAEVGLTAGHGKTLHVVAHSMGGLVSRWFIEREGGNEIVSKLFLLGTPNQGSPYGSVYEMASTLVGSLVNGASLFKPYILPLRYVGKFMDQMFDTLKQMQPDSDFLKDLNNGTDPGIPYHIIAGNTQLIPHSLQDKQDKLLKKIIERFRRRGHYNLLDALLFKKPNDIAVATDSITTIPGADRWQTPPKVYDAACHHCAYFAEPAGLEKLAAAVGA